jgi:26S proteasome regulatory subunit N5
MWCAAGVPRISGKLRLSAFNAKVHSCVYRYIVLCPAYSTDEGSASDYLTLRTTIAADTRLQDIPDHNDLLHIIITEEVTGADALVARFAKEMDAQESIFGGEDGQQRRKHFRSRICEHNALAVCKYYSQLRLARLATLLDLSEDAAEEQLADLVVKGAVVARIDRPAGRVRFGPKLEAANVLDEWGASITELLGLVETACQKIQKESMQHNVPIGTGA